MKRSSLRFSRLLTASVPAREEEIHLILNNTLHQRYVLTISAVLASVLLKYNKRLSDHPIPLLTSNWVTIKGFRVLQKEADERMVIK